MRASTPRLPLWDEVRQGCPTGFQGGANYDPNDVVSVEGNTVHAFRICFQRLSTNIMIRLRNIKGIVYECASWPQNLFCGMSMYEPATGQYWESAWSIIGSCRGTLTPTTSPSFHHLQDMGVCPDEWQWGIHVTYEEGDLISAGRFVFQCNVREFLELTHLFQLTE